MSSHEKIDGDNRDSEAYAYPGHLFFSARAVGFGLALSRLLQTPPINVTALESEKPW